MTSQKDKKQDQQIQRLARMDLVQLVIAVSAILISAASFYATYLQAESAERQVEAETWPYLQLGVGNVDDDTQQRVNYVRLSNRGVGPSKVRWFRIFYGENVIFNGRGFSLSCCVDETELDLSKVPIVTSSTDNLVLLPGDVIPIILIPTEGTDPAFIRLFNEIRLSVKTAACYCSLFGQCYKTNFIDDPVAINQCPAPPTRADQL